MYLSQNFFDQYKIKIPGDFICDMDNKYDLPVYISLMLSYTPFCKEPFSAKRLVRLTRVFRTANIRNKSMFYVADALLRLEKNGYIKIQYCSETTLKDDVAKSEFLFTITEKHNIKNFLLIRAAEIDTVLDVLSNVSTDTCHYSMCTLLHVYCFLHMNMYFWQRTYTYLYPAWIGHYSEIYKSLKISKKTMSDSIKIFMDNDIFTVCYGSTVENFTERQKTIVVFNKAITDLSINSVIHQVKERYNKSNTLKGSWYPPNSTVANNASNGVINKAQQCAESTNGGPNGDEFLSLHAEA